ISHYYLSVRRNREDTTATLASSIRRGVRCRTPRCVASEVHSHADAERPAERVEERRVHASDAEPVVARERRILVEDVRDRGVDLAALHRAELQIVRARQVER